MATAKQFVLECYPSACCEKMNGSLYYVYTNMTGEEIIGDAKSEGNAWENAKKTHFGEKECYIQ